MIVHMTSESIHYCSNFACIKVPPKVQLQIVLANAVNY